MKKILFAVLLVIVGCDSSSTEPRIFHGKDGLNRPEFVGCKNITAYGTRADCTINDDDCVVWKATGCPR